MESSRGPDGFFDPLKLTRAEAKSPAGEILADVTPQMTKATTHANSLYDLVAPWMRANTDGPSSIPRKLTGAALIGAGHLGMPGGEIGGGMLMAHEAAKALNPLYRLPMQLPNPTSAIAALMAANAGGANR